MCECCGRELTQTQIKQGNIYCEICHLILFKRSYSVKFISNPELRNTIFQWLRDYLQSVSVEREEGWHLTSLIYCLTKSYWDKVDPLPPTNEEVLLFASGLGLERVLVPTEQRAKSILHDGIWVSPDFITILKAELKTTRTSARKIEAGSLPETWIEQIKGGCCATGQTSYDLAVLCLMGDYKPPFPKLIAGRLEFEQEELDSLWYYIKSRLAILQQCLLLEVKPTTGVYCKDWECRFCKYKLRCSV